jgi:hypothetical protein
MGILGGKSDHHSRLLESCFAFHIETLFGDEIFAKIGFNVAGASPDIVDRPLLYRHDRSQSPFAAAEDPFDTQPGLSLCHLSLPTGQHEQAQAHRERHQQMPKVSAFANEVVA